VISITAVGLKSKQEINVDVDRKKKILSAVGLAEEISAIEAQTAILQFYDDNIQSIVIDGSGNVEQGKRAEDLTPKQAEDTLTAYLRIQNNKVKALAIPVEGKGLWSTLYGYLALESDLNTVRGITFYKHGETPGLGGEIEKEWFTSNFIGKKIFNSNGQLASITLIKGKVDELINDAEQKSHSVDGISGATITSRGVTALLKKWLEEYEPFIRKTRNGSIDNLV
jgi:Na+-transporting NADH:ubiquinone oxidoreductase subunit C